VRDGVEAVYPRLWRYALSLTGRKPDADDLVQTAVARAIERADQFDPDTHLDRWMFRITQRIWLNERRAQAVRRGQGLILVEDAGLEDLASDTETNILARQVLTLVSELPEAQRAAVMLVYVEGFRYREAADVLDIPVGTVMSRLAAARKALKKRMERGQAAQ